VVPGARVLIFHESERTRSLLADLLVREGLSVEAVESSFDCMARFVEHPADLVVAGLGGMTEAELGLFKTLKKEARRPRILAAFPSSSRDFAVRALEAGADAYVLEPFYPAEIVAAVRAQLGTRTKEAETQAGSLPHLAREVAHAINNPLQVVSLLLGKDKATKKELTEGIADQVDRIQKVVSLLKQFGAIHDADPVAQDPTPLVERAARDAGFQLQAGQVPEAMLDDRHFLAALKAEFAVLRAHAGEDTSAFRTELREEEDHVAVEVTLPDDLAWETGPEELLDAVFVVRPNREILPGLALSRALFEGQHGSLDLEKQGVRTRLVARVPKANSASA
jgi:CheY-like chemotaxis protein